MVLMISPSRDAIRQERLQEEASTHGLGYLAYLLVPLRGLEGTFLEVGQPCDSRLVESLSGVRGRVELHWPADSGYSSEQARALLEELGQAERSYLSERLHNTICQSLTAAHLHVELGLMTQPDAGEEFTLVRQLVNEATISVRELIDELGGEGE